MSDYSSGFDQDFSRLHASTSTYGINKIRAGKCNTYILVNVQQLFMLIGQATRT
jgi:hypothetical protein